MSDKDLLVELQQEVLAIIFKYEALLKSSKGPNNISKANLMDTSKEMIKYYKYALFVYGTALQLVNYLINSKLN